jgi:hypothetical protein
LKREKEKRGKGLKKEKGEKVKK